MSWEIPQTNLINKHCYGRGIVVKEWSFSYHVKMNKNSERNGAF